MSLLFDENLSPKLVQRLHDIFPWSFHVRDLGLASAGDPLVWTEAAARGLTIVSKDEDFHHLSFLRGAPPKVIGIRLGNCTTQMIEQLLRSRHSSILAFLSDPVSSFMALP